MLAPRTGHSGLQACTAPCWRGKLPLCACCRRFASGPPWTGKARSGASAGRSRTAIVGSCRTSDPHATQSLCRSSFKRLSSEPQSSTASTTAILLRHGGIAVCLTSKPRAHPFLSCCTCKSSTTLCISRDLSRARQCRHSERQTTLRRTNKYCNRPGPSR